MGENNAIIIQNKYCALIKYTKGERAHPFLFLIYGAFPERYFE